jgi:GNAT superfamily N-acetyltransferase
MTTDTPLRDASDAELAAGVQENLFALFRAMTTLPGSELVEGDKLSYHLTFPRNPMFKGVWRTRLAPAEADAAIDETLDWFAARRAPFLFWWTGPGTTPADLGQRLAAHGLISMEEQAQEFAPGILSTEAGAPGMVADLDHMNVAALAQAPPGFTMGTVQDAAALDDFKRVFIQGYQVPEGVAQALVDATLRFGIAQAPWKMVVGRLNGEPVAISMLLAGAGMIGVYAVATLPAARGKGIGGAITLGPLLEARQAGYRYAVLFATEMGIHAYERIGFRLCDVRINRFMWRNAQAGPVRP